MLDTVFPVLPLLIVCHAWLTIMLAQTLGDEEIAAMAPECYPV